MNGTKLVPEGYSIVSDVQDARNECYIVQSSKGHLLFVKTHKKPDVALHEYEVLRFLEQETRVKQSLLNYSFAVPTPIDLISRDHNHALICEYVQGIPAKMLILNSLRPAWDICRIMTLATAEIHWLLMRGPDPLGLAGEEQGFSSWIGYYENLVRLLWDEGKAILTTDEIGIISESLFEFFDLLSEPALGFPVDYYKDANPANWLIPANGIGLTAVDFETKRALPFVVDMLNITEYSAHYLRVEEKHELLDLYTQRRAALGGPWVEQAKSFNIMLLFDLFGFLRHQEQMLHRIRDHSHQQCYNREWQVEAYDYHLQMARNAARSVAQLPQQAASIHYSMNAVMEIYAAVSYRLRRPT